jgi:stalled ribosome rescue protein Dom34
MSLNHAIVWLDHREAHVLHFNADAADNEKIRAHSKHKHLHSSTGTIGSGHAPEDQKYYHEVAHALADAAEILIVGPSNAKLALIKHLHQHDPATAEKVVGVESVDHPSDGQLLGYARHYFIKVDQMRGTAPLHPA